MVRNNHFHQELHMKSIILAISLALFCITGFAQQMPADSVSAEYALPKKLSDLSVSSLPSSQYEPMYMALRAHDPATTKLSIIGYYDEKELVGVKNSLLDLAGNHAAGVARRGDWIVIANEMGYHQVIPLSPRLGEKRLVTMYFEDIAAAAKETVIVVVKDSAGAAECRQMRGTVDSLLAANNAKKDSSNPFFHWNETEIGLGYAVAMRDGSQVPHGPNVSAKFYTRIGLKIELGFFGLGSYEKQGGLSGYILFSYPLIGRKNEGLDIVLGGGISSFLLEDGRNKIAPDRSILYAHVMGGVNFITSAIWMPLQTSILGSYSPQVGYTPTALQTLDSKGAVVVKIQFMF